MSSQSTFSWPVRVYYEDTDAGGVVYHAKYLNFMERARSEWLREMGFEQTYLQASFNVIFVVHSAQIAYKKPAKFNDLLLIKTKISKMGLGSLQFLQKIYVNQSSYNDQSILVEASIKVACVNATTFRPTAIPKEIKVKMEQI